MVVPTIHGFTVDGVDNTGKNRVVEAFAASRPGTQVPDWAGTVAAHPELMQADDLHPIPAGAERRAQLIARGIQGCLASISAPTREPALESGPGLPPVGKFARRQASVTEAIGIELARNLAVQMAQRQLPLAAMLTMASSYA
jgi:hypothetical protein